MFTLDPILLEDTFFVHGFEESDLLLMNNANYPWLILVPRKEGLTELTDLSFEDQTKVLKEINIVADILQKECKPHKLNIANLGNVVSQLHIHVIARFEDDAVFPSPVWGSKSVPYSSQESADFIFRIKAHLQ